MRQKRNQSENGRKQPSFTAGYTLYNQTGQRFYLPNVKMAGPTSDQELERQLQLQQNVVQGGSIALKNKKQDEKQKYKAVGTTMAMQAGSLQINNKPQTAATGKRPPTGTGLTATQPSSTNTMILTSAPIYRIAHPYSSTVDMNARLWQQSTRTTKGLIKMNTTPKETTEIQHIDQPPALEGIFENEMLSNSKNIQILRDLKTPPPNRNDDQYNSQLQLQSSLSQASKPFQFLSSVGGKMLALQEKIDISQNLGTLNRRQRGALTSDPSKLPRPQTVSTISRINFNSMIFEQKEEDRQRQMQSAAEPQGTTISKANNKTTKQKNHTKSTISNQDLMGLDRPLTTKITKRQSVVQAKSNQRIRSADIDVMKRTQDAQTYEQDLGIIEDLQSDNQFYNQTEQHGQQKPGMFRPKSSWLQSRPLSGKSAMPEQFFQTYTKYTNFSALDLPYEELFDRNERTLAATFAKFGDLGYYSPIQRIGTYMQFSAKLKREHLLEIIDLQQTMTSVEKQDYEVPIQLAVVDEFNAQQSKRKTGINSGSEDPTQKREPITLSLFPEYFEDVGDQGLTPMDIAQNKFSMMVDEMGGNYDPAKLGQSNYLYIDPSNWPEAIRRRVDISLTRYHYYIQSEQIKQNEIPKFKKEWMVNAFNLLSEDLLQYEQCSRLVFQEIFETFKVSMKRAMLDYILRSPEERKRLHIDLLPRDWLCSSQRISREGGFNILLFPDWHEFYGKGREFCEENLTQISNVTSALQDWFQDFKHFKLCELRTIKQVSRLGYTYSITEFSRIQTIYRLNVTCLLQHIWHRGAILLIKKNKFLRGAGMPKSKWTFLGPKLQQQQEKPIFIPPQQNYHREFINEVVQEESHEAEDSYVQEEEEITTRSPVLNTNEDQRRTTMLDTSFIFEDECKECYISVNDVLKFLEQKLNTRNLGMTQFKDSCSTLAAYLERIIWLDNPEPIDQGTLSQTQLLELRMGQLHRSYKTLEKEARKRFLENTAVLMSLQLRRLVEDSLQFIEKDILSIPDYKSWCLDQSHVELEDGQSQSQHTGNRTVSQQQTENWGSGVAHQTLQQIAAQFKDGQQFDFQSPIFLKHQEYFSPFLKIDMVYEGDTLRFKETEDMIKSEFMDILRNIISTFDRFLQPKFSKLVEDDQFTSAKGMRQMQFNFDVEMGGLTKEDFEKFYKTFWPQVKIIEKQHKEQTELLLAQVGVPKEEQNTSEQSQQRKKYLQVAQITESEFVALENSVISHIVRHYDDCQMAFETFEQFRGFIDKTADKEIKQLLSRKNIPNEEFKTYIDVLKKYQNLLEKLPRNVSFPLFQVNCDPVIKTLGTMIQEYKDRIFNSFETSLIDQARAISDQYAFMSNYIRRSLKTPDEVELMEKYIVDLTAERILMKQKTNDVFTKLIFIFKQNLVVSDSLLSLSEELHKRPNLLDQELIEQEEKHAIERSRLEDSLRQHRKMFETRIDVYADDVQGFENFTEYTKYKAYIQEISEFEITIQNAEREMHEIVDQEGKLFGYASSFDKFLKLQKDVIPFSDMWKAIGIFVDSKKRWLTGPIGDLDYSEVEGLLKQQSKVTIKLAKAFRPNSIPYNKAQEFKEDVTQMNTHLAAIELLSNPGLRERHWDQIQSLMGIKFNYREGTLRELLQKGVENYLVRIEDVSENASKEFSLENALLKMEHEWETMKLIVINYKNRGVLVLQGQCVEDIQVLLDDHTMKAQTIRSNPAVKFMEDRAIRWERLMLYIQEVLEMWVKVQTTFLYLEPIFQFEDISKTLYEESEKFQKVSLNWNLIMQRVQQNPLVLQLEAIPNLLENLRQSLKWIEEIQKGLEHHLELKRLEFPRFFFLSNDDLINILSESRDPLLVQPHMRKCFEGIDELVFSSSVDILGMKSVEKEEVQFDQKVSPKEYKSSVEKWLLKVEEEMQATLTHLTVEAYSELQSYMTAHKPRQEWLRRWPAQCILACSCLNFTSQIEQLMVDKSSFTSLELQTQSQLAEIVNLVRITQSNVERMLLSALIVLEVHNNDILSELIKQEISNNQNFLWMSQMRYYIPGDSGQLQLRMVYTRLKYGYEYLGVGTRLVITPLTDRCYRTLVGALQLNLGGAPEGPAGTGKTESVKDLAKAIAVQCVVFNCGEGLNAHAMAKFFKGLSSAGAWSCFDEFNRIDLEVLSVIASQILQIQQAKTAGKARFLFEGTDIALLQSCNIFITMNPGYAGRSELPDNLKALFRPCAMMVPDYALIAEISLYSVGFVEARVLARKIVAVYKLCSEQLSSQDHYDYGMRAVKAVLTAAAQLKRKQASEREDILILRAITDINLPKFLTQDVMLFNGIVSDLFPGVKLVPAEQKGLQESMTAVMNKLGLQPVMSFKRKVLQLYEMVNCRHGLMIVGATLSGKSTAYRVLAQTLTFCNKQYGEEKPCQYSILNPKAITLAQLYGYSDPVSKEWTEGVLGEIYRRCATSQLPDRQFIVFDGPVDADWIENLNTVLDDNKKLCLMSGETIAMSDRMTIMFEVQDLQQASPATVSRCGMVYMQPDQLGWQSIFLTELAECKDIQEQIKERVEDLFESMMDKCITFIKNKCVEYEKFPDSAFVISGLRFFRGLMKENFTDQTNLKFEEIQIRVDALFVYSILWTVGGVVDETGRKLFDQYFKKLLREPLKNDYKKDKILKFERQTVIPEIANSLSFDFYFDFQDARWRNWKDSLQQQQIPADAQFNSIMVETSESLRITSLLNRSVTQQYPFLLIGPSGVGKTRYIRKYLQQLAFNKFLIVNVNFSATTSSLKMQQQIDTKLERRRKGVFGPALGIQGLIFIDDLNMPQADKYGAQPPLELLRQLQDQGGWYSHERMFMSIINMSVVASMSPPGGGRPSISQRLLRHFNVVALAPPDLQNMQRIYNTIVDWHLKKVFGPLVDLDIIRSYELAIESVIDLYTQLREGLKPTPAKSWYFLNMRDISRCVQGMTLASSPKEIKADTRKIARLWLHETSRTFFDRLHESDYDMYWTMLNNTIRQKLRDDLRTMMKPYEDASGTLFTSQSVQLARYFFSDIMGEEMSPSERQYTEVTSIRRVTTKVEFYLDELNSNSKKPLNLAMFDYAIEHLLKILRVLRMQQGHTLLIGLGGSGRQSLTKLAGYIREMEIYQSEVTKSYSYDQWREDLQKVVISTGVDGKECIFVLADHQMSKQFLLEDINALLNTGDVPNLFAIEDFFPLIEKLRVRSKKEGLQELFENGTTLQFYDYFVESAKRKLHIVLTMSPIGDSVRNRIRLFPSIVNCTNIDCYQQWPDEALEAVAKKFLSEINLDLSSQRQLTAQCKFMHETLISTSQAFLLQEGRINYITPGAYFGLLGTFQSLLAVEKQKLEDLQSLYSNGVLKLDSTQDQVKLMEQELIEKTPLLKVMNEETTKIAEIIQAQALAMEPKKVQAMQEEMMVNERVKEAQIIKEECEKDLSVAKPKLRQAEDALNTLDSNDINSIKAMLKPPETVQLVMEAVCVLCGVPAIAIPNPKNPKERLMSYWEASKKFLSEKDFLQRLIHYDKEGIKEDLMKRIRDKYTSQTAVFNAKRVEKASSAAKGLCEWVLALDEYEKVLRVVRPKQMRYNQSKSEVERFQASLRKTRDELEQLNQEIHRLQEQLHQTQQKQEELTNQIRECELKLIRASELMGGLGGERDRWETSAIKYEQRLKLVLGDMIISAGAVSNLGVFSATFRQKLIKQWQDRMKAQNGSLQSSDHFSLELALSTPMLVRKWRIHGLPSDAFSTENGIILNRCQRYPLLIDPQSQGNRFIKQNETGEGQLRQLKVIKQTDNEFLRTVEIAVSFGQALLIENVGEDIDQVLDSLLQKQTFKQAAVLSVKLGEAIVEFNKAFTLFLTSKLRNPHYSPETAMKVTLVNFTITQNGLEDQLLELCVSKEKPDLEEQKNKLILQTHQNQQELQKIEDRILDVLKQASNILDDEEGIQVLQQSKVVANDIEERQKIAEFTQKKIDEARIGYKQIAVHSALLFFAVISLSPLDPMYQYSLSWFINLYQEAFDKAEQSPYLRTRIESVNSTVMQMTYNQVCRGLFEKDKLLFAFIIQVKIMEQKKHLDANEFNFLLSPIQTEPDLAPVNPFDWIPQQAWYRVQQLMKLSKRFSQLPDSLLASEQTWRQIMVDTNAHQIKLPEPYVSATPIQKLCIQRVLRPDKLTTAISEFISAELGEKFTHPPTFSLLQSFVGSSSNLPLLFVLPGTDPMQALSNFAESKSIQLRSVSLGQGQGVVADKEIEDARQNGNWVILQNCHLAPSWMPRLEKICEELQRIKVHPAFRLWITSYSSNDLPASVVQSSIKMTNEPPNGIKANLIETYSSAQIQQIQFTQSTPQMLSLLYTLSFFHAVLQERRSFGSIGFNIRYEFNQSDLYISIRQLQLLVQMSQGNLLAFDALHYLVGECNYGGRVTDERDRRVLRALLKEYMSEAILNPEYKLGGIKEFLMPQVGSYDDYCKYINALPKNQPSQLFGFHPNAEIIKDINSTEELLRNTLIVTGGQLGTKQQQNDQQEGPKSEKKQQQIDPIKQQENQLRQLCTDLLAKFPKKIDYEIAQAKYPIDYKNSINTVFLQEILRYNKLVNNIQNSLKEVESALKGIVAMSDNLEKVKNNIIMRFKVAKSIQLGQVPEAWKKSSYPSIKPLGSFMDDFFRRLKHYLNWMDRGPPQVHWISGFFFTQSFLTATLQNYARKYTIAIDKLGFDFEYMEQPPENEESIETNKIIAGCIKYFYNHKDGQLIYGLYLEGCRWDYNKQIIVESEPKVLQVIAPIIWLKPVQGAIQENNLEDDQTQRVYKCPVYKTAERRGVLSTTGHSTNFIMIVNIPSLQEESHWIKRGVAMLCQLSN